MENTVSSFRIVAVGTAWLAITPPVGLASTNSNPSLASCVLSPTTETVTVRLACPAANDTVPEGSTPPTKSAPLAGLAPLPFTANATVPAPLRSPTRCTVKVKLRVPPVPSARAPPPVAE